MSDDTPTQRFEPEGSDAPTQRLDAAAATETVSPEVAEERKSRKLMIILGIIGAALLLAIIILLVFLLVRPSSGTGGDPTESPTATRSASPTPSSTPTQMATPSPTPTPTPTQTQPPPPPPPSNDATVNSFTASTTTVTCNSQAPGGPFPIYIDFSWSSSNASNVYFGVNTADASAGWLFDGLPPSGTTADFPDGYSPFEYNCGNASTQYTITVVGSNGSKSSKSVTVVNNGDVG